MGTKGEAIMKFFKAVPDRGRVCRVDRKILDDPGMNGIDQGATFCEGREFDTGR